MLAPHRVGEAAGIDIERQAVEVWDGMVKQESLALASMARDDSPASSTTSSTAPASSTAAAMSGKVFET